MKTGFFFNSFLLQEYRATTSLLHHSTSPPHAYSTTPLLHYSTTPQIHHSTTQCRYRWRGLCLVFLAAYASIYTTNREVYTCLGSGLLSADTRPLFRSRLMAMIMAMRRLKSGMKPGLRSGRSQIPKPKAKNLDKTKIVNLKSVNNLIKNPPQKPPHSHNSGTGC